MWINIAEKNKERKRNQYILIERELVGSFNDSSEDSPAPMLIDSNHKPIYIQLYILPSNNIVHIYPILFFQICSVDSRSRLLLGSVQLLFVMPQKQNFGGIY